MYQLKNANSTKGIALSPSFMQRCGQTSVSAFEDNAKEKIVRNLDCGIIITTIAYIY